MRQALLSARHAPSFRALAPTRGGRWAGRGVGRALAIAVRDGTRVQSDAGGVAVGEFDASGFKGPNDVGNRARERISRPALKVRNGFFCDAGCALQVFLRPLQKGAGGAAVRGSYCHFIGYLTFSGLLQVSRHVTFLM